MKINGRDVAWVCTGTLWVSLAAQLAFQLPLSPVPITLQSFAVVAVGGVLGARRGALSMMLYLLIGALGLPVFADGASGLDPLVGRGGGYLFGFVLAAYFTGWLCQRGWGARLHLALLASLLGTAAIFAVGLPRLAFSIGMEPAMVYGMLPFLPGAAVKICLSGLVIWGIERRR